MKANELQKQIRIGNHLLGKCIDDLDDRKEWWEIYKIQDAEHLKGIKENWDKPIELTEEILLKCGFYLPKNSLVYRFDLNNEENKTTLQVWKECNCFSICRLGMSAFSVELNYLHQLQNLYFALTGEELEINL